MPIRRIIITFVLVLFVCGSVYTQRAELGIFYTKARAFIVHLHTAYIEGINQLPKLSIPDEHASDRQTITPGPLVHTNTTISGKHTFLATEIIKETNIQRRAVGLPDLKTNTQLSSSAKSKTADMLAQQYFEHTSPSGKSVGDLVATAGYEYILVGENLAYGDFRDEADVVDAWMQSPGHKANMLNVRYTEIGVGVMIGTFEGREVVMAVQHFGLPLSSCPKVDEKGKAFIQSEELRLDAVLKQLEAERKEIESMEQTNPAYDQKTDTYNEKVNVYNQDAKKLKQKIEEYNQSVKEFNDCIEG